MTKQLKPDPSSEKPAAKKPAQDDTAQKYNKLKKRYKYLREEYSKVLESWELGAKSIKSLLEERRFLKKKLDSFFKSQHFIDDKIFKEKAEPVKSDSKKMAQVDLTPQIKTADPVKKEQEISILGQTKSMPQASNSLQAPMYSNQAMANQNQIQ